MSNFYPRPPRGGRRYTHTKKKRTRKFLSTPSARRATKTDTAVTISYTISIHALREEGDDDGSTCRSGWHISIHALREEGDLPASAFPWDNEISIHALREEGDSRSLPAPAPPVYFYPRPPRGGRRREPTTWTTPRRFLSTPSARRATSPPRWAAHLPWNFYPRPPRGGRPSWAKEWERAV